MDLGTLPILFTISTPRLTTAVSIAIIITMSSTALYYGIASDQALPRAIVMTSSQDLAILHRLKIPTVTGNSTILLARSILMARFIIW